MGSRGDWSWKPPKSITNVTRLTKKASRKKPIRSKSYTALRALERIEKDARKHIKSI